MLTAQQRAGKDHSALRLRIVTWNCQGAYGRKAPLIEALHPDIAIIQECKCPDYWRAQPLAGYSDWNEATLRQRREEIRQWALER
jgi:hypothetical protein